MLSPVSCFRSTQVILEEVPTLQCNHEEANTKLILHTADGGQVEETPGLSLVDNILGKLNSWGHGPVKCRGQEYDDAGNMESQVRGCATLINKK